MGEGGGGRGKKKPSYVEKIYVCAFGYSTTRRQALLVVAGRHLLPFAQCLAAQPGADPWVFLQPLPLPVQRESRHAMVATPHLTLPRLRAAGEEVSSHFALSLHLDQTSTVQLVSIAVQHVVKVCGHLTKDTHMDKASDVLSKTKHKHVQF